MILESSYGGGHGNRRHGLVHLLIFLGMDVGQNRSRVGAIRCQRFNHPILGHTGLSSHGIELRRGVPTKNVLKHYKQQAIKIFKRPKILNIITITF